MNGVGPLSSPIEIDLPTANSREILFQPNFTPGQLKITPYSLCNGTTKLYSNTVSINIHSNPLPHVLILTAIVVGVATLALGLALTVRIREAYGSIEEDEILAIETDDNNDNREWG